MVISDIEMPKMDGYSLVTAIRENPKLSDLYVILHSSLSGVFNESMVKKVGADHFLAKFMPDELVGRVTERLKFLA
ncbi:MAG: response regulator, partial [Candidatus Thiodiazotropha sp. (ex Cardiolucina cf. quadrata)]|nr:response regulator [Candidatus Thiodiazotropha sp. (ex Cardiolucina cf. quadrata)]